MRAILLALFSVLFLQLAAQSAEPDRQVIHQKLTWYRYYNVWSFGQHWTLHTEIEDRRYAFPDRQNQWLLPRIHLHRKLGQHWEASAGMTYFLQSLPAGDGATDVLVRPSFWPHQELRYQHGKGRLTFWHRYRQEERFTRRTGGQELIPGYDFTFRARYLLMLKVPVLAGKNGTSALTGKVYNEVMFLFGPGAPSRAFQMNHTYGGLNYSFSKALQVELGYLHWFQPFGNGSYYSRDLLRLTVYHRVEW